MSSKNKNSDPKYIGKLSELKGSVVPEIAVRDKNNVNGRVIVDLAERADGILSEFLEGYVVLGITAGHQEPVFLDKQPPTKAGRYFLAALISKAGCGCEQIDCDDIGCDECDGSCNCDCCE